MVDHWLINSLNSCLPQACLLCGDTVSHTHDLALCLACQADLPVLGETCLTCANPLDSRFERLEHFLKHSALLQTRQCGKCIRNPPSFDRSIAFFPYIAPFNHFVLAAKFKGKLATARLLGELMAQQIINMTELFADLPDQLLPVPLHPRRQRERGYNQALEIARPLQKRLQIPIFSNIARRITDTPPQTSLILSQRKQNLRDAFEIETNVTDQHIAIIDDVMTSGTTVNALANKLKQAGARKVSVWSFCRAEAPS